MCKGKQQMKFWKLASVAIALILSSAANASPLDIGNWQHVARMSHGDSGMFDGNGELLSNYSYGAYTGDPLQTSDFQTTFDVYAEMEILFITGDQEIWGRTSYSDMRTLIDARQGNFNPNIIFDARVNGIEQQVMGNVLSRNPQEYYTEDPWITLLGGHIDGVNNDLILWGESGFDNGSGHSDLKNQHLGVNVYVSTLSPVPVPAAVWLFGSGLISLVGFARRKKA